MAQVKEFVFMVGGESSESTIFAFSIDQAKRLLREALGNLKRLPKGTVLLSASPTDKLADNDVTTLQWEKEEVATAKKERKELKSSGRLVTVFVFTMKDGSQIEIVETAQTRAKALLREKLNVARLPSGITCEKVEKIAPLKKLEREIEAKKVA